MRWLALAFYLTSLPLWACEPETKFSCAADDSHFSIVVDSVQTTLSKEHVTLTVAQLPNHQSATIQNSSDKPLYLVTDKSEEGLPYVLHDKKKWYVQAKYTNAETSCVPKSAPKQAVKDLEKIDWDCKPQLDSCNDLYNTNTLYLPPGSYPLGWAADGLVKGKIVLPDVTEQKFTQFFLHENKLEKVSLVSTLSLNEDYLTVTCDKNAKIEGCGENCRSFTNLTVAIKNPASAKFQLKTDEQNFSDLFEIELFVDQDFKSRLVDAGGVVTKISVDALAEMQHYGDLRRRPIDYITMALAQKFSDDLVPLIGTGWKFHLTRLSKPGSAPIPSEDEAKLKLRQKRAPAVFPRKNE